MFLMSFLSCFSEYLQFVIYHIKDSHPYMYQDSEEVAATITGIDGYTVIYEHSSADWRECDMYDRSYQAQAEQHEGYAAKWALRFAPIENDPTLYALVHKLSHKMKSACVCNECYADTQGICDHFHHSLHGTIEGKLMDVVICFQDWYEIKPASYCEFCFKALPEDSRLKLYFYIENDPSSTVEYSSDEF